MSKYEFEELSIPKWKIGSNAVANKVYRVFKDDVEFSEVEAASASEAIEKSGMEDAYMVKSGSADSMTVFDQGMLVADEVAQAAMDNATSEAEKSPEESEELSEEAPVEAAQEETTEEAQA